MTDQPQPQLQLIITVDGNGAVQVAGPIDNAVLCYGLLALAADSLRDYWAKKAQAGGLTVVREPLPMNGGSA